MPEPSKDLVVPELAVGWLVHPVPLVREIDQLARNAPALERGEQLQTLADRDSEIEVVVDDQHRSLKVLGESMR